MLSVSTRVVKVGTQARGKRTFKPYASLYGKANGVIPGNDGVAFTSK
jgi:hypothetical protein